MLQKDKTIFTLLADAEIWLVASLIGVSMLKTSLLPWAVLIAALFWGIRWMAHGSPTRRTPVDFGVILLVVMIPVTLWATALPEKTIPQVYRLLSGILLLYAIINWAQTAKRLGLMLSGLILVGLLLAIGATFSVVWPNTKLPLIPASIYQRFSLLVSDTVHPNVMAGSIILILPVGIALLLFAWKSLKAWQTISVLIMTLITTAILILTQSRGALMGFGAMLILMVVWRWRWGWLIIPTSLIGIAVLVTQFGIDVILEFISSGVSFSGVEGRVEIWSRAIYMIQDFSFTGIGLGSYLEVADLLYPFFLAAPGTIHHAHNLLLQIAVDLGVPGLIAWLSIWLGVSTTAWRLYSQGRRQNDVWMAGLGAGFMGSQIAMLVHGLTDAVTWGMVRPAPLVWAIWGLTIAAWMILVVPQNTTKTNTPTNPS